MTPRTLTAKLLRRRAAEPIIAGSEFFRIPVDLVLGHDATIALLIERFQRAGRRIWDPTRCFFAAADRFSTGGGAVSFAGGSSVIVLTTAGSQPEMRPHAVVPVRLNPTTIATDISVRRCWPRRSRLSSTRSRVPGSPAPSPSERSASRASPRSVPCRLIGCPPSPATRAASSGRDGAWS